MSVCRTEANNAISPLIAAVDDARWCISRSDFVRVSGGRTRKSTERAFDCNRFLRVLRLAFLQGLILEAFTAFTLSECFESGSFLSSVYVPCLSLGLPRPQGSLASGTHLRDPESQSTSEVGSTSK